jgi:hypothetical protein
VLRDSVILSLRLRQESVAGHQYARLHIGASITRANSENGALLTREPKHVEKKNNAANDQGPNAACGSSTSLHYAVIRVHDSAGNVIETQEHKGDFKEP